MLVDVYTKFYILSIGTFLPREKHNAQFGGEIRDFLILFFSNGKQHTVRFRGKHSVQISICEHFVKWFRYLAEYLAFVDCNAGLSSYSVL